MAAVTFVHIGDFHASPGERNADRFKALDQIVREGRALPRLAAWLWPGDLFDALSTIADRNAIDARLQEMADRAPVVIVYGNHDKRGDLDGFANLGGAHPIIVVGPSEPRIVEVEIACTLGIERAAIFCLPYPHRGGLVAANVAAGDLVETANGLFDPIFMQAAADLEAARARGLRTLMIFHANVAGAIASTGQPVIGREIELSRTHLDRLGDIYKGGNHIHNPQEIGGAWFAGSCAPKDYGEVEPKRYLLVDIEADSTYTVRSCPLDVPPMFHLEGRLDREGYWPDQDEELCAACAGDGDGLHVPGEGVVPCTACNGSGRRSWAGRDVRVRYRYLASERAVLDEQVIRARYASALRLKVEGIAIVDRDVRQPAVVVARHLPEKLAAMREDGVLPPSMMARVEALEQMDRDELLADVRTWLTQVEQPASAEVAA